MTLRETNAIPRPLDNGDITEGRRETRTPDPRSGGGSPFPFGEPNVSFTTKLPINQFNTMQQHCFDIGATMAGFVREAIAEKLRRAR